MNLEEMKKQMGKLGTVAKELKKSEEKSNVDERFFKPTKDSAGNISCIIRFLPQLDFSKAPYIQKYGHYITVNEKTFMCMCPENENEGKGTCPVCEKAAPHWKDYWVAKNAYGKDHPDTKAAVKQAGRFTRNTQTVTNIQVIQNPNDKESEGKVFLYSMPKAVLDKYKQKLMPKDVMDIMVLIHHPLEGRNFKLEGKTTKTGDLTFIDYKGSYFYDQTTPISENEEEILAILNETHDLTAYSNETKPDVEDINKRFNEFRKFLGEDVGKKPMMIKKEEIVQEPVVEKIEEKIEDTIEEVNIDDIDSLFE